MSSEDPYQQRQFYVPNEKVVKLNVPFCKEYKHNSVVSATMRRKKHLDSLVDLEFNTHFKRNKQ